jgi:hypothetical protein
MRMPRRRLLLLPVAATIVGVLVLGWFATRESSGLQRFRKVRVGMTLEELKTLYPKEEDAIIQDGPAFWMWQKRDEAIRVWVDEEGRVGEAVYAYRCTTDRWLDVVSEWTGIDWSPEERIAKVP